jgi:hypothetical protein
VILRRIPAHDAEPPEFLAGANAAFGAWGDAAFFAWAFRDDAEILFLDDAQGRAVAGSGITYRTLRDGQPAAIMTGSWTLPQARGEGAFSTMLQATCEIAAERHAVVLGFGRMENASARRFVAAGAAMPPAFYCRSTEASALPAMELEPVDPDPSLFPSSFVYTKEQWQAQFLARPNARVECLGLPGALAAVVERSDAFDRVHAVSDASALPQLAARAHTAGRRLFWYTTQRPAMACEWTDGFLASLPPVGSAWTFQNGDRM